MTAALAALLALAAMGAAVWIAQRLGRARAERDFHEDATTRARRARAIEEGVDRLPDRELDRRLRPFRRR